MNFSPADALQGWIPYKLFFSGEEPFCRWLYTGDKRFEEPFFDETISACQRLPANSKLIKCISSVDVLPGWSATINTVHPTAFIFHISRCGSTLLSQMLAMDTKHIVLPEVPFFDELLRMHYQLPYVNSGLSDEWLQAAISFHGQIRSGTEEHLFIKADCWHIFFYERLRKLYPQTPFVLLYRSPDEVLQSQQKRRGMQAVPGIVQPELMGLHLEENDPAFTNLDVYFSRVMEKMLAAFVDVANKDNHSLLVNYNEGLLQIAKKVASFAGVSLSAITIEQMQERSRYHGKYPGQVFEKENKGPSSNLLNDCWKWYYQLEEKRKLSFSAML